uniref:Uncharacterized protein n=1 Tax=Anguilla anguilla TaxID=7936 RepID=A0A0E9TIP4_ANGAN
MPRCVSFTPVPEGFHFLHRTSSLKRGGLEPQLQNHLLSV